MECLPILLRLTGYSSNSQPRLIHCVNVINVSCIYYCPHQHRVPWHNTCIVSQQVISSVLFHFVCGIQQVSLAFLLITLTMHVSQEHPWNKLRTCLFPIVLNCFTHWRTHFNSYSNFDPYLRLPLFIRLWRMCHAIEACCLQNFCQRESAFYYCMSQTSSDGRPWLSCDHTFNFLHAEIIYTSPFINAEIKFISQRSKCRALLSKP